MNEKVDLIGGKMAKSRAYRRAKVFPPISSSFFEKIQKIKLIGEVRYIIIHLTTLLFGLIVKTKE